MKKLMVALAAIVLSVGAQAAVVQWQSGAFLDWNGVEITKGATGYTATIQFFTYDSDAYTDVSSTFGGTLSSTTVAKGPTMKGNTGSSMDTGTYYAQLTIVNGDWTLTSDKAAFAYDAEAISDLVINFTTGDGFSAASSKFNQTGATYGWTNVPEPTSGMLLLLGMAGLALRRRRA